MVGEREVSERKESATSTVRSLEARKGHTVLGTASKDKGEDEGVRQRYAERNDEVEGPVVHLREMCGCERRGKCAETCRHT